jgi:hypothetical protein
MLDNNKQTIIEQSTLVNYEEWRNVSVIETYFAVLRRFQIQTRRRLVP